jgi:hypothetical protein
LDLLFPKTGHPEELKGRTSFPFALEEKCADLLSGKHFRGGFSVSRPIALAKEPGDSVCLQHGNDHLYFVPDCPALQLFLLSQEAHKTGQVGAVH